MCFYTASSKRALALAKRYGRKTDIIEIVQEILDEQYKVTAFTHPSRPVITANESVEVAKWGLIPHWTQTVEDAKKISKMCINAKAETVFSLPSFRSPILTKRCLIPATGYFEFHHPENEKTVIPYHIFLRDEEIFSFGGLYELWQNPVTKERTQTFTILTVPANELCAKIHNGGKTPFRMPLIVGRENEERWLDNLLKANEIKQFFVPFETGLMDAYPVSKDFLKKKPDDASIIERAA
jgi:putative SOS response-associated peptidase YedK